MHCACAPLSVYPKSTFIKKHDYWEYINTENVRLEKIRDYRENENNRINKAV